MRFEWSPVAIDDLGDLGLSGALRELTKWFEVKVDFSPDRANGHAMARDDRGREWHTQVIPVECRTLGAPSFDSAEDAVWEPPALLVVTYTPITDDDRYVFGFADETVGVVSRVEGA